MSDHKPSEPSPNDFKETAQKSEEAGIADEAAAYVDAATSGSDDEADKEESGHPS